MIFRSLAHRLKRTIEAHGIKGTVKLFGTPAEETVVGKVYMASERSSLCFACTKGTETHFAGGLRL